ncbi:group I truncated hemoglobin [Pseudomarimonas arenosa]|uniref:Group 1 truncated hemoglobin n=1 Tax=Pseudomarimonas arenosa TaxID=2774145 RepID=A0AAW3ZIW4_9GAMM|nr:group 1 truncated hemoglobin [Pseudomarimonas arenosa]MBD8524256.1 group 1 truncated hemoglobin [Pseudomarimonas arenosa]
MPYAIPRSLSVACLVLALAACQHSVRSERPLYDQVGGEAGVAAVVDGLLHRVHGDSRLNGLFETTDLEDLRRLVNEQLCEALGGPCVYSGRSMEDAHSGLAITDQEFDWFVEHLVAAMNHAGVQSKHQSAILAVLGPMRPQVVGQ